MQPWQECSLKLLETGELDPVYNVVAHARDTLGPEWAKRFCMAHLMFYDFGESVTLADVSSEFFWHRVLQGYPDRRRGQERRHFRGAAGLAAIDSMRADPPEVVFDVPLGGSVPGLKSISRNIGYAGFKGFGTYFLLKWADFLDVVHKASIDYSGLVHQPHLFLFEGAAKGLDSIWKGRPHHEALTEIADFISDKYDPFQRYRLCGLSEAETIACAYRTYYVKTTYKFGWDINNLRKTLERHPSKNAKALLAGVPALVEGW